MRPPEHDTGSYDRDIAALVYMLRRVQTDTKLGDTLQGKVLIEITQAVEALRAGGKMPAVALQSSARPPGHLPEDYARDLASLSRLLRRVVTDTGLEGQRRSRVERHVRAALSLVTNLKRLS